MRAEQRWLFSLKGEQNPNLTPVFTFMWTMTAYNNKDPTSGEINKAARLHAVLPYLDLHWSYCWENRITYSGGHIYWNS